MLVVSRLSVKKMKGQPWWGWCTSCMVKHCLLLEGHTEEGISKAVREKDFERAKRLAELLNVMVDVRKVCEEMYLEERWNMYLEGREGENASSQH